MEKVRESYIGIFISFKRDLRRSKNPEEFRAAVESFIDARQPVAMIRGKTISGLSKDAVKLWRKKIDSSVWGDAQDDKVEAALFRLGFFTSQFFSGGDFHKPSSSLASRFAKEIGQFTAMSDEELRALAPEIVPMLTLWIDEMVRSMEHSWLAVSKEFNELRLHYK